VERFSAHRAARSGGAVGPVLALARLTVACLPLIGLIGLCGAVLPQTVTASLRPPPVISLAAETGRAGDEISIDLTLISGVDAAGLQADLSFDRSVALLTAFSAAGRAAALSGTMQEVEAGRVRLLIFSDDANLIPTGNDAVGTLTFRLVGELQDATDLTLSELVLSDSAGGELVVDGNDGSLSIDQSPQVVPEVQLAVLPNPGNPRWLQIMVEVRWGSVTGPTVTVDGNAVPLAVQAEGLYQGQHVVPASTTTSTVIATDSNDNGPGTVQVDVGFGGKDHDVD